MNTTETNQFIEDVLCKLWPGWTPTDEETVVWYGVMNHYDYETARTAAQQSYAGAGGRYKSPKPSGIIEKAKLIVQNTNIGRKKKEQVLTNVFIECLEPPERNPKLKGKRKPVYAETDALQCDPDHVRACAETMRWKFEDLYGGHWITIIEKPPVDSGLRGQPARDKAFADIMSGPDSRTKRWLTEYLEEHPDPDLMPEVKMHNVPDAEIDVNSERNRQKKELAAV